MADGSSAVAEMAPLKYSREVDVDWHDHGHVYLIWKIMPEPDTNTCQVVPNHMEAGN